MLIVEGWKTIALQTRAGNDIENRQYPEYTSHERWQQEGLLKTGHMLAVSAASLRCGASNIYNCHGMTFACRRTGIHEQKVVELILRDDGFKAKPAKEARPGDVVLYFEGDTLAHSG